VSCTWTSLPSPSPKTLRSTWVGLSLRRTETTEPVSSMKAWAMYRLPPDRSANPRTTCMPCRPAAAAIRRMCSPSRVIELSE
jgi:hypothetical protein